MHRERGRAYRLLSLALTFGLTLLAAMFLGFQGGAWLDRRLGTDPWLALLGLVLGVAAAFRILFRDLLREFNDGDANGGRNDGNGNGEDGGGAR